MNIYIYRYIYLEIGYITLSSWYIWLYIYRRGTHGGRRCANCRNAHFLEVLWWKHLHMKNMQKNNGKNQTHIPSQASPQTLPMGLNFLFTVGRHRLGPEHVQISTPETWPHPNTMRASGARALGGMFGNARATHTAKLCPKNTGAKTQKCWDKKSCAGSAGAKKVYAGHARSHIGTLLPRDVSLHDCRHIEIDA